MSCNIVLAEIQNQTKCLKSRKLFFVVMVLFCFSCKRSITKSQLKGEWTVINIDYDSTLTVLEDQEFKRNMSPFVSLFKFSGDSLNVLSIDKMQEQLQNVFLI